MSLYVPGKTFLVGEYSVLLGGSALGLATKPFFQIDFNADQATVFHPDSPAGRYLQKHGQSTTAVIQDPYHGGFGRSTAEYWAVVNPEQDFHSILKEYKSLHSGSGIDLAFQYFGRVCLADPAINFYQTFNWHFENLDFFIISSGFKVNTHEHLKDLRREGLKDLVSLSDKITNVYASRNENEFLSLMKEWSELLIKKDLTHPNSVELKGSLEKNPEVKLAKPCGALGADVLLVFFDRADKEKVRSCLQDYLICAESEDLCEGVEAQFVRRKGLHVV